MKSDPLVPRAGWSKLVMLDLRQKVSEPDQDVVR